MTHQVEAKNETTGQTMLVAIACEEVDRILKAYESSVAAKDAEIAQLRSEIERLKSTKEKIAPVQGLTSGIPWSMHLRAYDVYCKKYGKQQALIEGWCRGGFSTGELDMFIPGWREELNKLRKLESENTALREKVAALEKLLNTPETDNFDKAVPLEAAHQVNRWGAEHDAGKNPEDWFWLIGFLAGKALAAHRAGDQEKAKHHCISTAAVLRNWHAHIRSGESVMRPGISAKKAGVAE